MTETDIPSGKSGKCVYFDKYHKKFMVNCQSKRTIVKVNSL